MWCGSHMAEFSFVVSCLHHCTCWPCSTDVLIFSIHVTGTVWHNAIKGGAGVNVKHKCGGWEKQKPAGEQNKHFLLLENSFIICLVVKAETKKKKKMIAEKHTACGQCAILNIPVCLESFNMHVCVCVHECLLPKESGKIVEVNELHLFPPWLLPP